MKLFPPEELERCTTACPSFPQDASGRIFYQTSREVARGETLHVWFSDVTAHALNVPVLTPNNIRGLSVCLSVPKFRNQWFEE